MKLRILKWVSAALRVNPYLLFYYQLGIFNYKNLEDSGEEFFIKSILKKLYKKGHNLVLFDVGGNKGDYSKELAQVFPSSCIFCFEPNPDRKKDFEPISNVSHHALALSDQNGETIFYADHQTDSQTLSSFYPEFISRYSEDISEIQVKVTTVDTFCDENGIQYIDFIKIDTEGHELFVLRGSKSMLKKIGIIQFEFNTSNVYSRTFLKDFYDLLEDFSFYRLGRNCLIDINLYFEHNEIFAYQNIIAVSKRITQSDLWNINENRWVKRI